MADFAKTLALAVGFFLRVPMGENERLVSLDDAVVVISGECPLAGGGEMLIVCVRVRLLTAAPRFLLALLREAAAD
jgi:hypothetical protein